MATGFIYVVTTLAKDDDQKAFCNVPTEWRDRLYFGPCKRPMRPKMKPGDWIFGISPARVAPRRIVFVAQIEKRITFAQAYRRFPGLRGPQGPIHVRPIKGTGRFPQCSYKHIDGAMHEKEWERDLASPELDAFFICFRRDGWRGRWLGASGPKIDDGILAFLKTCSLHGRSGMLNAQNTHATLRNPICRGRLYTGLHLETDEPERLLRLCGARITPEAVHLGRALTPRRRPEAAGRCGASKHSQGCG